MPGSRQALLRLLKEKLQQNNLTVKHEGIGGLIFQGQSYHLWWSKQPEMTSLSPWSDLKLYSEPGLHLDLQVCWAWF